MSPPAIILLLCMGVSSPPPSLAATDTIRVTGPEARFDAALEACLLRASIVHQVEDLRLCTRGGREWADLEYVVMKPFRASVRTMTSPGVTTADDVMRFGAMALPPRLWFLREALSVP